MTALCRLGVILAFQEMEVSLKVVQEFSVLHLPLIRINVQKVS